MNTIMQQKQQVKPDLQASKTKTAVNNNQNEENMYEQTGEIPMQQKQFDYLESVALRYAKTRTQVSRKELVENLRSEMTGIEIKDSEFNFDTDVFYGKNIVKQFKDPANKRQEQELDRKVKTDDYMLYLREFRNHNDMYQMMKELIRKGLNENIRRGQQFRFISNLNTVFTANMKTCPRLWLSLITRIPGDQNPFYTTVQVDKGVSMRQGYMIDYFTKELAQKTTLFTRAKKRDDKENFKQAIRDWINVVEGFEPQDNRGIGKLITDSAQSEQVTGFVQTMSMMKQAMFRPDDRPSLIVVALAAMIVIREFDPKNKDQQMYVNDMDKLMIYLKDQKWNISDTKLDNIQDAGLELTKVLAGANGQFGLNSGRVEEVIISHEQEVAESKKRISLEIEDGTQQYKMREENRAVKKADILEKKLQKVSLFKEQEQITQFEKQGYRNELIEHFLKSNQSSVALAFDPNYKFKFINDENYEEVGFIDQQTFDDITEEVPQTYQCLTWRQNHYYKPRVQMKGERYMYDNTEQKYKRVVDIPEQEPTSSLQESPPVEGQRMISQNASGDSTENSEQKQETGEGNKPGGDNKTLSRAEKKRQALILKQNQNTEEKKE